jgi:MFS family permease
MHFTGLWRHPNFLRFWAGEIISLFGSQITDYAFPLTAIFLLKATPVQMGILTAAGTLPMLLSLFVGVWVDRLPRRPIMIISDLGRAVLLATVPLVVLGGMLRMEYLYVLAFCSGTLSLFFDIAYQAYFPSLVPRDRLIEGNSKLEMGRSLAQITGPGLALVLVQVLSAPVSMVLDAASFAISGLLLSSIRAKISPPIKTKHTTNLRREIREGIDIVVNSPLLRPIAAASLTLNFFGGLHDALFLLYVLSAGLPALYIGLYVAVGSISGLFAAVINTRITKRLGLGPLIISGAFLIGFSWLAFPLIGLIPPIAVVLLIWKALVGGFGNATYNVSITTLSQAIIPDSLLGRYSATISFFSFGLLPLGAVVGGFLATQIGLQNAFLIGTLGSLTAFIWPIFSPLRKLYRPSTIDETRSSMSGRDRQALEWELYKKAFEGDGMSRNIYVFGTKINDWQKLIDFLHGSSYDVKLLDKEQNAYIPLLERADLLFPQSESLPYLLQVDVGKCILHCHFFYPSEIEFTLDCRDVTDGAILSNLLAFMKDLGRLYEKDTVLTVGNMREWVLIRFDSQRNRIRAEFSAAALTPAFAKSHVLS